MGVSLEASNCRLDAPSRPGGFKVVPAADRRAGAPRGCVLLFPKMAARTRKSGGMRRFAQFRRRRAACRNLIQRHNRRRHPLDFETAPLPPGRRVAATHAGLGLRGIFRDRVAARASGAAGARGRRAGDAQFRQCRHRRRHQGGRRDHRPQFRRRSEGQGHDQHHFRAAGAAEPRVPDAALGAAPAGLHRHRGRRRGQDRARSRREAAGRRDHDRPGRRRRRPAGHAGDRRSSTNRRRSSSTCCGR